MGLRDIGAELPPGFRFYPSDEELVGHYLLKKISNEEVLKGTLVEIDLHTCEPWQLPGMLFLHILYPFLCLSFVHYFGSIVLILQYTHVRPHGMCICYVCGYV